MKALKHLLMAATIFIPSVALSMKLITATINQDEHDEVINSLHNTDAIEITITEVRSFAGPFKNADGSVNGDSGYEDNLKIEVMVKDDQEETVLNAIRNSVHTSKSRGLKITDMPIGIHYNSFTKIKIHPNKIGRVMGKGGATIREIAEATNSTIDITDEGIVRITAVNDEYRAKAVKWVKDITADVEVGKVYTGKVVKILEFGAFVQITPGIEGLVHISEIAQERVNDVGDHLKVGDKVKVKVLSFESGQGKIKLSIKATVAP
jgi:polyribonucleotide nucleotidyltransferase